MGVLGVDVDVGEEVGPHEGMVALWVVAGEADVLVHVEGDDVFERDLGVLAGDREGNGQAGE